MKIHMLDCTLRDGAYVVDSNFGTPAIKGIIKKMRDANIDIIECGWLKDKAYEDGSTFFHVPSDLEKYITRKGKHTTYVAMIDWDRYDLCQLPPYDGKSIDAIRVVFPYNKYKEGIALGTIIKEKGYQVYFQAANTLGYSDEDLVALAEEINQAKPVALSIVDTFGAMYSDDLEHIVNILNEHLSKDIMLGLHAHNNQQLAFSLAMRFGELLDKGERDIIIDSCLCGMGRGAGNATTELVANYLNRKYKRNYDMNVIMDAIDLYMGYFVENYKWGYCTPYFISGIYCAHVNNIAYLMNGHRTSAKEMKNIIESLSENDRTKYDYDLLEEKYLDYQNKVVDDEHTIEILMQQLSDRKILLVFPGSSALEQHEKINKFIEKENPVVIGINAVTLGYSYDYLFFSNVMRYNYARDVYSDILKKTHKIITSNIKSVPEDNEHIVNFNMLVKRGWTHFDNSGIMCLRLLNKMNISEVYMAGFDGFEDEYSKSYADNSLPHINPGKKWDDLNSEVKEMFSDFVNCTKGYMNITFLTESKYEL